jgi:hypothetical protein
MLVTRNRIIVAFGDIIPTNVSGIQIGEIFPEEL